MPGITFDWQKYLQRYRWYVLSLLLGAILFGVGILQTRGGRGSSHVEVLSDSTEGTQSGVITSNIVVEISGEVKSPGVYTLSKGSRINDLINMAQGFNEKADIEWISKNINKASVLTDGQKIFIPNLSWQETNSSANNYSGGSGDQTISTDTSKSSVNINNSSSSTLESLWGIGQVTAQKIIDNRPYSTVEELLSKKILKKNVYDKIKDQLSVY